MALRAKIDIMCSTLAAFNKHAILSGEKSASNVHEPPSQQVKREETPPTSPNDGTAKDPNLEGNWRGRRIQVVNKLLVDFCMLLGMLHCCMYNTSLSRYTQVVANFSV